MHRHLFVKEFGEPTLQVIVLGFLTFGVYYFIWIAERRKKLNEIANKEIFDKNFLIYAAICSGLPGIFASLHIRLIMPAILILQIAYSAFMIAISWQMGKWLEEYANTQWGIELRVNTFLLLFFNILYVNYLINKIADMEIKEI